MLGTREDIEIGEDRIALDLAGIFDADMVGVGVHRHDLLLHLRRRIGDVDTIAKGFRHLRLAVRAGKTHRRLLRGEQALRLDERLAVDLVELAHDLARLLQHRLLIFAHGDGRRLKCRDVRRLADRIGEEAHRDARLKVAHLNLRLDRRIALQARNRHEIHIVSRHLEELRHFGLHEHHGLRWIKSACHVVERDFDDILTNLLGIVHIVGQCLRIGDHDVYFIVLARILQLNAPLERADVMSEMKPPRRTVACQYDFLHAKASFPLIYKSLLILL